MKSTLLRAGLVALVVGAFAGCGGGGGGGGSTPSGTTTPSSTPASTPATSSALVVTPTAQATAAAASVTGESCSLCHTGTTPVARTGPQHQAGLTTNTSYDDLYQHGVIKVSNMAIASNGVDTTTLTFKLTKNGAPLDCTKTTDGFTIGSYYDPYDATNKKFTYPNFLMSLKPSAPTYDGVTGVCTFTKTFTSATDLALVAAITTADGIIQVYGVDEVLEDVPAKHMKKGRYPFGGLLRLGPNMGAAVAPYVSAANVSGCENCHTQPFGKHAYIPGKIDDLTPGTANTKQEFYACKGCHSDAQSGHTGFWQLLKEAKDADKTTAAGQALRDRAVAVNGGAALTADETTKYAYKTRLMNDVHMSHAMEFAYPQSVRNCVTCHDGKMDETTGIFKSANFRAETCISCHAPNGIIAKMSAASYNHSTIVADLTTLRTTDCTGCHGAFAPSFKTIHTGGYDPKIYAADGTRYSTNILAKVDTATYDAANYKLTVGFSASGTAGVLDAKNITPTVLIGLYGYNTKDFIVNAHATDANKNKYLEFKFGDTNPRFTGSGGSGSWQVVVDLTAWKDMITAGTVKRAQISVMPGLKDAKGSGIGLDAASRTFDLTKNAFDDAYFADIVNVKKTNVTNSKGVATVKGCNTCHDSLQPHTAAGFTTGGTIKVCRTCHVKSAGGYHLEIQSRSIDSWAHAIHSYQAFDVFNINFADAFDAMEYKQHTGTFFPRFGLGDGASDCESCHVNGQYGVPDQSKSLPALWSASATLTGTTRNIGSVPSYVSGPAATACGGCHRAQMIVADNAGGLTSLLGHWKANGYLIENMSTLWDAVVAKVMK